MSIICPYHSVLDAQPVCQVVADITDLPLAVCHTNDSACEFCLRCTIAPQTPNKVTASMSLHACERAGVPASRRITDPLVGRAAPEPTVETLPCIHRGPEVRMQECKPCAAGGGPLLVPVYTCESHDECTLRNIGSHPKIQACTTCEDRQP